MLKSPAHLCVTPAVCFHTAAVRVESQSGRIISWLPARRLAIISPAELEQIYVMNYVDSRPILGTWFDVHASGR